LLQQADDDGKHWEVRFFVLFFRLSLVWSHENETLPVAGAANRKSPTIMGCA
jgi:hypothetical protein